MNIVVKKSETSDKWEISGVLDFEESHLGFTVEELSTSVGYFMTRALLIPGSDPIDVAAKIIEGFCAILPLTESEREILYEAATMRLVVSYSMASYYKPLVVPEKVDYLFVSAARVPAVLTHLDRVGKANVLSKWFPED